eukprot:TRINITY_DN1109_c0_g1_i1.p1 TRINITY_DN1109_c0_g1~~TRINITY_DN1109_c0_g1_i1.p1  ORF type:complete len:157 (+),score=21.01 TRINITY_DN1109_c0_g1_i1:42-473(+)
MHPYKRRRGMRRAIEVPVAPPEVTYLNGKRQTKPHLTLVFVVCENFAQFQKIKDLLREEIRKTLKPNDSGRYLCSCTGYKRWGRESWLMEGPISEWHKNINEKLKNDENLGKFIGSFRPAHVCLKGMEEVVPKLNLEIDLTDI